MLGKQYIDKIREMLGQLEGSGFEPIHQAAHVIADSIAAGGSLHRFDTGHMREEPIHRAGGLCGVRNIDIAFEVTHPKPPKFDKSRKAGIEMNGDEEEAFARYVLNQAHLQQGDVLIANSNSGKTGQVVETALAAQKAGLKVVAITAVAFSQSVPSLHSSGKRLCEIADVTIDTLGVPGDAALEVEGIDTKVLPTSGVMSALVNWVLTGEIIDALIARGITPEVFRSINLPGGEEYNTKAEDRFNERGI